MHLEADCWPVPGWVPSNSGAWWVRAQELQLRAIAGWKYAGFMQSGLMLVGAGQVRAGISHPL